MRNVEIIKTEFDDPPPQERRVFKDARGEVQSSSATGLCSRIDNGGFGRGAELVGVCCLIGYKPHGWLMDNQILQEFLKVNSKRSMG